MPVVDSIINLLRENIVISIVWLLLGAISFLGFFFRNAIFYEYKKWREDDGETEELKWYKNTASLARQVQRVWESKYVEPNERNEPYSKDEVKAEMGLLADQLDRHASNITADTAPPEFVTMVYETAQECRSVENCITGIGNNQQLEEQGEKAVKKAEELEESAKHRLN
jgi:hypothetical protein